MQPIDSHLKSQKHSRRLNYSEFLILKLVKNQLYEKNIR